MAEDKIKVFVVDSSEVWRKILINHVASAPDMEIVGEITSGQGCILMLDETQPDIVLLELNEDARMPVKDVITQMKRIRPEVRIILCAEPDVTGRVLSAADKNANDFITKPYKRPIVLRSIRECMGYPSV